MSYIVVNVSNNQIVSEKMDTKEKTKKIRDSKNLESMTQDEIDYIKSCPWANIPIRFKVSKI